MAPTIQARETAEAEWQQYEKNNFPPPLFMEYSAKGYLTEEEIEKNNQQFEELKPAKQEARNAIFSKHINEYRLNNLPVFLALATGIIWLMWRKIRSGNG